MLPILLACTDPAPDSAAPAEVSDTGKHDPATTDTAPESIAGWDDTLLEGLCQVELTCDDDIIDEPKTPCSLQIRSDKSAVLYDGLAGVERRGRSSKYFPKANYAVELWSSAEVLLDFGHHWRYLDTGEEPAEDWTEVGFDDSSWPSGPAPLGYGDDPATTIDYGDDPDNKHITTWLRLPFTLDTLPHSFQLSILRDDGVAVYLNGVELLRDNLPDGELTADTLAIEPFSGDDELEPVGASVDGSLLQLGENVLAVRLHQASASSSDLSFDLQLLALGPEEEADLFGMGTESDWILGGNYIDRVLFRNRLAYDLFRDFGHYAPELVFCELTLNGAPQGLYDLTERIKKGPDRVDISADDDGGSFIVKTDDKAEPITENRAGSGDWVLVYPRADRATEAQEEGIAGWLNDWQDAIYRWDPDDPEGVFSWLDRDSALDIVLLQELTRNNDGYTLSVHLSKDAGELMQFVPWDFDLTFGYPVTDCGAEGWLRRQDMIAVMVDMPGFKADLSARWAELRAGPLADDALLARMARYRALQGDGVAENFEIWPFDEITFLEKKGGLLCPVDDPETEYARFQAWTLDRTAWMDANIDAY